MQERPAALRPPPELYCPAINATEGFHGTLRKVSIRPLASAKPQSQRRLGDDHYFRVAAVAQVGCKYGFCLIIACEPIAKLFFLPAAISSAKDAQTEFGAVSVQVDSAENLPVGCGEPAAAVVPWAFGMPCE